MVHPDERSLLQYISDRASEEERIKIDTHIAGCPWCLERVRALHYLRENFDSVWGAWTAGEYGRLYRQWQRAVALRKVVESIPSLAEHIKDWLWRIQEGTEIAVKILVDRTKKLSTAAAGALPQGYDFALQPAIRGVGAPDKMLEEHLRKGSELLSEGQDKAALSELEEVSRIDARLPQAAVSEIRREGARVMQVVVDSRRGMVSVKLWPRKGEPSADLVLLLPKGEPGKALVAEFKPVEDAEYLLGEFNDLPTGQFDIIVIELLKEVER